MWLVYIKYTVVLPKGKCNDIVYSIEVVHLDITN